VRGDTEEVARCSSWRDHFVREVGGGDVESSIVNTKSTSVPETPTTKVVYEIRRSGQIVLESLAMLRQHQGLLHELGNASGRSRCHSVMIVQPSPY